MNPGSILEISAAFTGAWNRVTGFDAESRRAAMGWLRAAPGLAWRWVQSHPGRAGGGLLLLCALAFGYRLFKREPVPAEVLHLEKAMARAGLAPDPTRTPRERLMAHRADLDDEVEGLLCAAVESHEKARYGA